MMGSSLATWGFRDRQYFEDLVEARVLEDLAQVRARPRQAQLPAPAHQPLLRLEEHPEPRARDVLEPGEVEGDDALGHPVEKGLRRLGVRGVEPAGERHAA